MMKMSLRRKFRLVYSYFAVQPHTYGIAHMKRLYIGTYIALAVVLMLSGCGMLRPDQGGNEFEWEYLFDEQDAAEGAGALDDPLEAVDEGDLGSRRISSAYELQFDDTVVVSLLGLREFREPIETTIDENGEISMPYIDDVKAEGKTSSELADYIKDLYIENGIYKDLNVKVMIPSQNSYYIRGEVKRPGGYPWKSGITLSQAISSAAGVTEYASSKVYLTRRGEVQQFDIRDIEKDPSMDVLLRPDDQIRVKRSIF